MNAKHFILGALLVAAPALAKEPKSTAAQAEKLPRSDVDMLKKLHQANREEIELGQVALQQSQRDEVRQFAKMLVDDHRMADEKITKMADMHGVPLGDDTDAMKMADKLGKKSGDDFEKEYLEKMVKGHDKVISLVSTKQNEVRAELQSMLNDMLPTLRHHRMEAKRLLEEVKGSHAEAQGRTNKPTR